MLWVWGVLGVLSGPAAVVCLVATAFLQLGIDEWTVGALGCALWLRLVSGGFSLIITFSEERTSVAASATVPAVAAQWRTLDRLVQGLRGGALPSWAYKPLGQLLGQLSLLIVGLAALVRLAYGEPILRLFF